MITGIHTWNFRMLSGNRLSLRPFQVLVGQNGTGKSTFLSAFAMLSRLLRDGVPDAVSAVASNFEDLCFARPASLGFVVEMSLPNGDGETRPARYEIEIGRDVQGELRVLHELLLILAAPDTAEASPERQRSLFPPIMEPPFRHRIADARKVVSKTPEGKDYFRDEKTEWNNVFRFGLERTALGSLPEDPDRFPLAIEARNLLRDGPRLFELQSSLMRAPAPPRQPARLLLDGSHLPYLVRELQQRDPVLFAEWVAQLRTGVKGLFAVEVWERPEDKHLVLRASFEHEPQHFVPSWLLSDGTLRLMALTLVSYAARASDRTFVLIEEPENGLHPLAIQTAFAALSRPPSGTQVLVATHSPVLLANVQLEETLVFRRQADGSAMVRRGTEVPELAEWRGGNLTNLFVTGVLG